MVLKKPTEEKAAALVDLACHSILKREPSDILPDLASKFKRGDEVTIVRRMTWTVPRPGQKEYRKDIVEGTEGIVEGWADSENRKLLMKSVMNVLGGGGPRGSRGVHRLPPLHIT